jgi:hypothetical protein
LDVKEKSNKELASFAMNEWNVGDDEDIKSEAAITPFAFSFCVYLGCFAGTCRASIVAGRAA